MKLALKRERFYRFFSRNSSFRIPFYCVFLWAVEWIHKSLTAIFSQPMFLANIRTALFEKERERKSPQGWRLVKSREFEGKFRFNGSYALHSVSLHSVSHSVSLNTHSIHCTDSMDRMHCMRFLRFPWQFLITLQELRISRKSSENRVLFREHIWSTHNHDLLII